MAPEQWLGSKQDFRTDVYAFGVTMYEMCYGHMPFPGPNIQKFQEQHLRAKPLIPSSLFASIVERCLSKNPLARYTTPMELLEDLTRACQSKKVPLPPKPKMTSREAQELAGLAQGLSALGKTKEALAASRKLVELEPQSAGNWNQLGCLLLELHDHVGAKDALLQSLALDETRSPTWNNLGIALQRQQKWRQALSAFDHAIDRDPFNTAPMLNSTEPLRQLGHHIKALDRLKRASEIAPDKYQIWNNLGAIYLDLEDKENCLACCRRVQALAPPISRVLSLR
jgi:tetratricopeptide (TPR) repeat protein